MPVIKVEPELFENEATVQVDSDAREMSEAIEEVEDWAWEHGFIRTHERNLRPVLVDGKLRFRGICYRISKEEEAAMDLAQRQMIERAERMRGLITAEDRKIG